MCLTENTDPCSAASPWCPCRVVSYTTMDNHWPRPATYPMSHQGACSLRYVLLPKLRRSIADLHHTPNGLPRETHHRASSSFLVKWWSSGLQWLRMGQAQVESSLKIGGQCLPNMLWLSFLWKLFKKIHLDQICLALWDPWSCSTSVCHCQTWFTTYDTATGIITPLFLQNS